MIRIRLIIKSFFVVVAILTRNEGSRDCSEERKQLQFFGAVILTFPDICEAFCRQLLANSRLSKHI